MADLDASIILGGQPVNMLGILDASNRMAGEQKDRLHTQDYRNMLATNGAGIMAGDQNALNALAGFDPTAALGVKNTRQEMDFSQQKMGILNAQERRQAEEYARGLSADQRAAEAKQIEDAVKMGMMIPDAATWDQTMVQMAPELVGMFDQRQALASRFMEFSDVMKMAFPEPVAPLSSAGKLKADLDAGRITPEQFAAEMSKGNMSFAVGPDGTVNFSQGAAGATGMKLTEQQSKDLVYWQRATGISEKLDQMGEALANYGDSLKSQVPVFGNAMVSAEYQQARQAGEEWLSAVLRKDTGAALTAQEMEFYGRTYLPQPGDGPEVLSQKQAARKRAEEGIRLGLGTAEILAQEVDARRGVAPAAPAAPAATPAPAAVAVPDGIDPEDWAVMTPEEQALWAN